MTSILQVLKSLQCQQNLTDIDTYYNEIEQQAQDQPDLNLLNFQYNSQNDCGYSFIEYVPFRRKVIDIQQRVYKQRVPKTKIITYEVQSYVVEQVPTQKIVTDYFAVQHLRYYKKQKIPQKTIQYVPVVRKVKKIEFVPVERYEQILFDRKIVHYPKDLDPAEIIQSSEQYQTMGNENSLLKNLVERKKIISTCSPIKQLQYEGSDYEHDINVSMGTSILNSLSKAYTPEPSTQYGEATSYCHYHKYADPVSPFQLTKSPKPSTFKQVNYRSTETIDSKYFMN